MTTKGCYRISKELVIRRVFQKDGVSLPSANIVFEKELDSYGNVVDIEAIPVPLEDVIFDIYTKGD